MNVHLCWGAVLLCAVLLLLGCQTDLEPGSLEERLTRYAPTRIDANRTRLPMSERYALEKIIEASRYLDEIFYRQAFTGNPKIRERLERDHTPEGRRRLLYFTMMKGPWDRQEEWEPFAIDRPHPQGAGFYPRDMTREEFAAACAESPEREKELKSLFTLVRRGKDRRLVTVPYRTAYREWLEPAAKLLEGAAELTRNESLKRFLRSRAKAFRTDDYYESDKDWMDLDSLVEVTIGPYEVYEDELLGCKAAYEAFVTVVDPRASRALASYKNELADMEQNLPVPDAYKSKRGRESPIRVADLVYASGEARTSVQTLAFNLPNDERVRKEKGAKKVLLANVIREKFNQIMIPLGQAVMSSDQVQYLSGDAFFNQVLFHELSHSMGPAFVGGKADGLEVRLALEDVYSAIEEAKADVMGACNVLYQVRKGTFPSEFRKQLLASYFTGLFRSVRFGLEEAHGKGAALQINTYFAAGAAAWEPTLERLTVDFEALEGAIGRLLGELLKVQFEGDKSAAASMLAERGRSSPEMEAVLACLHGIPVDLRPIYPAAGE